MGRVAYEFRQYYGYKKRWGIINSEKLWHWYVGVLSGVKGLQKIALGIGELGG